MEKLSTTLGIRLSAQKGIASLSGQISPKGCSTPAYSSLNASSKRIKLFPTNLTISQNITEKYLMETTLPCLPPPQKKNPASNNVKLTMPGIQFSYWYLFKPGMQVEAGKYNP